MSDQRGHLFVVHGRIESLVHDAAILPVGQEFRFNQAIWNPLVGNDPRKPTDWSTRRWGRVTNAPDRVWAVSVGGWQFADPYDEILDRVESAIARISERRTTASRALARGVDSLPLVAVPVIGIGLGGYAGERGAVLLALVARLHRAAAAHQLDIALVTPDASVYAAAQYSRRRASITTPFGVELECGAGELGRAASEGQLALFLGAGVGVAAGLPSWKELVARLARELQVHEILRTGPELGITDQAALIELADKDGFKQRVADISKEATRPSLLHALLAGLDCGQVVTTNYDQLYETAVEASGRDTATVLPWASALGANRWVLKLHGDAYRPDSIVLTRRHMLEYDAANRPSGALLQSLLLTKRLLMVGVSMTDDNVIRLAAEVEAYRDHHQQGHSDTFGTVLDAGSDAVRSRLWAGQLDWITPVEDNKWSGPRGVELFLDRMAMHAARDSSWLLDVRFDGLGTEHDRLLARQVRDLYSALPQREGTKWWPLVRRLRELGADAKE